MAKKKSPSSEIDFDDCYFIDERISKYFEQVRGERESEIRRSECKNCKIYRKFKLRLKRTPDGKLKVKQRLKFFRRKRKKMCIKCLEKKIDESNWFEKAMEEIHITERFLNGWYEELLPITREVLDEKDFENFINDDDYFAPPCFNFKSQRMFLKELWKDLKGGLT